jgi:hypothetical protein
LSATVTLGLLVVTAVAGIGATAGNQTGNGFSWAAQPMPDVSE